jgi:hypothetical protein
MPAGSAIGARVVGKIVGRKQKSHESVTGTIKFPGCGSIKLPSATAGSASVIYTASPYVLRRYSLAHAVRRLCGITGGHIAKSAMLLKSA